MFRKILIATIALILLAIFSNPSLQSFKEYIGNKHDMTLSRPSNYFVFSIYQCNGNRYIGAISNFFYIRKEQPKRTNHSTSTDINTNYEPGPFSKKMTDTTKKIKFMYDDSKSVDENLTKYIKVNNIKLDSNKD